MCVWIRIYLNTAVYMFNLVPVTPVLQAIIYSVFLVIIALWIIGIREKLSVKNMSDNRKFSRLAIDNLSRLRYSYAFSYAYIQLY